MTLETALKAPLVSNHNAQDDRRRRTRLKLAYPIRLFRSGSQLRADALTENISSDGFFCVTRQSFTLREIFHCELVIPAQDNSDERDVVLRYKAEVVRIVRQTDGSSFGIGCRLVS